MKLGHVILGLCHHLGKENLILAGDLFERLMYVPGWLTVGGLEFLHWRIKSDPNADQLSRAFLEVLLLRRDISFTHFRTIVKILELGGQTGKGDRVYQLVSAAAREEGFRPPRFSNFDLLAYSTRLGSVNSRLLAELKYRGYEGIETGDLVRASLAVANQLEIALGLQDRVHAASKRPEIPRENWMRAVTEAFAIDHVVGDWITSLSPLRREKNLAERGSKDALTAMLDMDAAHYGFRHLRPSKGALFTCFHGGFLNLLCHAFLSGAKSGVMFIANAPPGGKFISIKNPNAALYMGVKAIEDGNPILIAADARAGKYNSSINVLDIKVPMPDGAPFIAYETGCETIWLSVERLDKRFVPIFVPGPVRRTGETFKAFRERWFTFYEERINETLCGEPYNITVRMQWAQLFAKKFDPNQIVG